MGNRFQDVNLDFGRAAVLVGSKFELKTRAELGSLETELAALVGPALAAVNGLTVTLNPEITGVLPTTYQFDTASLKFVTQQNFRSDLNVNTLTFDLSTLGLRSGEKFLYLGPAGTQAFTFGMGGIIEVIGEQTLEGGGNEMVEVLLTSTGSITLTVTPLTRGAAAAVTFFTTLDLVAGVNTVTHNLGLVNKDAFVTRIADSAGSEINVDVDSVGVNSLTLTTLVPRTGVRVFITGSAV